MGMITVNCHEVEPILHELMIYVSDQVAAVPFIKFHKFILTPIMDDESVNGDDVISSIKEFLDSIGYSREEDSYFPCVASYDHLKKEIRALLIEHEFSRNIAYKITHHLKRWKNGEDSSEPVARFLRTYSIYLNDHISKEEDFFERAEKEIISKEEEKEMFEQFQSDMAITKKLESIVKDIDYLENQPWFKN